MVLMLDVLIGATFVISCCCTWDPTAFILALAPLIAVAVIVPMLRTVMGHLEPFMSIRILLHDSLCWKTLVL